MTKSLLTLVLTIAFVAMPFANSYAAEEVDDIFMDEGASFDEPPPADGGDVAGPIADEEPAPEEEAPAPKKAKPVVERPSHAADRAEVPKKALNPRKTASVKGGFRVLKSDCALHEQASDDSPVVLTSKASKKLWVEEQESGWVKGFHKAGEGFFSSACFE